MRAFEKRFVNSPRHSSRVAARAERLVRIAHPRPGQRLLDVGCGNGAAAIHLASKFDLLVTGVDVDPEQIEAAIAASHQSPSTRFLTASATQLPFRDNEFDMVFTTMTTHHIPNWEQALQELIRVLRTGGHLIYADFVAPIGQRLPTRRAIGRIVEEHRLYRVSHTNCLFVYAAVLRAPPDGEQASR
jgi:ubiquinone/menaquinone biosynthesis C-methylase UbiE